MTSSLIGEGFNIVSHWPEEEGKFFLDIVVAFKFQLEIFQLQTDVQRDKINNL